MFNSIPATAVIRSIRPELFQSECFLCCRKLNELEDTETKSFLVVDPLIKLLHFQKLPLRSAAASDYKYQIHNDEEYYQELFQKTSFCYSCLEKIFVIKSAVEQFEQLQQQLVNLQKEVSDSLSSCCTKAETELNPFRERLATDIQLRSETCCSTKPAIPKARIDFYEDDWDWDPPINLVDLKSAIGQTKPSSTSCLPKTNTDIKLNDGPTKLPSLTVKLIRLEDLGIVLPPIKSNLLLPDVDLAMDNAILIDSSESTEIQQVDVKVEPLEPDSKSDSLANSSAPEEMQLHDIDFEFLGGRSNEADWHAHSGQKNLICKFCTKPPNEFNARFKLWRHLRDCHQELFIVESMETDSTREYNKSAEDHHCSCSFCLKIFKKVKSLRQHQFKWHTEEVVQNPEVVSQHFHCCGHCGKSFTQRGLLRPHLKTHDASNVPCSYCSTVLRSKSGLESHLLTHHPEEAVSLGITGYKCDQCQLVLSTSNTLQTHIKVKHNKEFKFLCQHCDFKCLHHTRLRQHILSTHEKVKAHVCQHCGLGFATRSRLTEHLRTHTGEKPYQCKYCGKKFHIRRYWKRHEPIHGKERPFECKLCDSKFPTQNNLTGHIKSHHKGGEFRIGVNPKRKSKYDD